MKYLVLLISLLFISTACSVNNDSPVGFSEDIIKLSQKEASFSSSGDSIVITTEGETWWVENISLDGTSFDLQEVNTLNGNFEINAEDFVIERKNATEIHISMTPNSTQTDRVLRISLEDGNYFDGITITQAAQ